jgi:hypothetical protein
MKRSATRMDITIEQTVIRVHRKAASIFIVIDDERVRIDVPPEVKAYFDSLFVRENPTALQKKKYATLMSLVRAAYRAGVQAGEAN